MISRIEISTETVPAELKKEFRKKLMTGGAVLRLQEGISSSDLETIVDTFLPLAEPHNISSMVLVEVVKHEALPASLAAKLAALPLPNVVLALGRKNQQDSRA